MLKAIIMAGGSGTRLWPLSRANHPKQFLALHGEDTMLQSTFKRLEGLNIQSSVTVCNDEHRFFVAEQLRQIDKLGSIILEPIGKNTAPAIAVAALASQEDEDPILLVLPADHVIQDEEMFRKTVLGAIPMARSGHLVTFGIEPHEPNTGYGYIKKGKPKEVGFMVDSFVEKPSIELATEFVKSEDYLWNSGMFLFTASRFLEELKKHRPDIYDSCQLSLKDISKDNDFIRINKEAFENCPSVSIDYAVMEKTDDAVVVAMDVGWSDIGSWSSLWDISKKDSRGNAKYGDVIAYESNNSYMRTDEKLIAAIGVDDLVIVSTKDVVFVAHKDRVQDVKVITQQLKDAERTEWSYNREVYRPWGKYDSIANDGEYQVKKLTVAPGAKLSVQKHFHRSEHWVVVAGQARVHYGGESFDLQINESTYHGKEVVHALENSGEVPLELIEVQVGSYLGEDDIVRLDDIYGRLNN
ncbi:mannose-1-phosphate guanylyltransferase/mannose-6-phosphate isomerase [Alphaproteobacteria bacterium]|nr:mannose-1-phosphate guanylyltransferase/mannose-6-phosphate isomerase [Alphaproteobacteria bacterium]